MNGKNHWPMLVFRALALLILAGLTLAYLLHLGRPNPLETITNIITSSYALLAMYLGISIWSLSHQDDSGGQPWAFLSFGIGFWAMAEVTWAFLSFTSAEVPYPSMADAFWLPGYLMILISATLRYRALKANWRSRATQILAGLFVAVFLAVSAWVIYPIASSGAAGRLVELILNILYPIGDLLVLFAALLLTISFSGGRLSSAWGLIAAGLATLSVSDILFTYAAWNGLYAPDGNLNWTTTIIDIGNLGAYLLLADGMLLSRLLLAQKSEPTPGLGAPASTHSESTNILKVMIFTDSADKVIFSNQNLQKIWQDSGPETAGKVVWQVLGIGEKEARELSAALRNARNPKIQKYICLQHSQAPEVSGWLLGTGNFNDLREFTGADLTCEMESPSETPTAPLSASATLVFDSREAKLLLDYFAHQIYALHQAITQLGGGAVSQIFRESLRATTQKHGCAFHLEQGTLSVDELPIQPEVYPHMLADITAYAVSVLSGEMVASLLQRVAEAADPETLAAAQKFGLTNQ